MTIFTHMCACKPNNYGIYNAQETLLEKDRKFMKRNEDALADCRVPERQLLRLLINRQYSTLSELRHLIIDWEEWQEDYKSCRQLLEHKKKQFMTTEHSCVAKEELL